MQKNENILVLGVGNVLYSDDGFGICVVDKMNREYEFPENVNVVDGGVLGINLLGVMSGYKHIIIIDTILKKSKPGDLHRLEKDEIRKRIMPKNSLHQVDLLEALTLCDIMEKGRPETVILGIEPKDYTTLNVGLSDEVKNKIDDIIGMTFQELDRLGATYKKRKTKKESDIPFWK